MQGTVKITEFPANEISEKERIKASEKAYHQAEQSIKNERLLKSGEYPKEVVMRLEESNRIGTIRAETVQELVRCKDCKWWTKQSNSSQGRCELGGIYPTGAWFCANGERK